jgi:prepilin-type N-terminal cleavage/methylation domain-containing protein
MNSHGHSSPRRSGFTLVEILVAMAVLSIVAVGLLQILGLSMQTWPGWSSTRRPLISSAPYFVLT